MIIRMLTIAGGLVGAAGLSQYPEFAQQYTQRLAGQVEALEAVVTDFDATATRAGLDRAAALEQMSGSAFLEDRQQDMTRAISRYERLTVSLDKLEAATPMERLLLPHRLGDPETLSGTWNTYKPAMPLTAPGAVSAGVGYVGGWLSVGGLMWLMAWPFRRRRRAAAEPAALAPIPPEPPLRREDPQRPVLRATRDDD